MKFPARAKAPGWPRLTFEGTLDPDIKLELQNLVSLLQGLLGVNHNQDGTHSDVMADSVSSVSGFQERGRDQVLGEWENVPWSPTLFAGSGAMTWPVTEAQVTNLRAARVGNMLFYAGKIDLTNVGGVGDVSLRVMLPYNQVGVVNQMGTVRYVDAAGAPATGYCIAGTDDAFISIRQINDAAWTVTAANDTSVQFTIACQVQEKPL